MSTIQSICPVRSQPVNTVPKYINVHMAETGIPLRDLNVTFYFRNAAKIVGVTSAPSVYHRQAVDPEVLAQRNTNVRHVKYC